MKTNVFSFLMCASLAMGLAACQQDSGVSPKFIPQSVFKNEDFSQKPQQGDFEVFRPKVDILFVIDNSGSMSTTQQTLARNARSFANEMSKISFLDFHIGVTTTDMDACPNNFGSAKCGRLVGEPTFVDRFTPGLASVLSSNMIVGTNGSATEMMFTPIFSALSAPIEDSVSNKGFYRPNAFLAVILITDAKDQSVMMPKDLLQFLNGKKGDPRKVLGYGVIRKKAEERTCTGSEELDFKLEEFLAGVSNGDKNQSNVLSLCDPDFGRKLIGFAKDIVDRAAGAIKLGRVPVPGTIRVFYGKQEIPNDPERGWVYIASSNSIRLSADIQWDFSQGEVGLRVDFKTIEADPTKK